MRTLVQLLFCISQLFIISFILSHKDPFMCHWFCTIRCTDYRSEYSSLSKRFNLSSITYFHLGLSFPLCTLFNRWFMILILINCYIACISIYDVDLISVPFQTWDSYLRFLYSQVPEFLYCHVFYLFSRSLIFHSSILPFLFMLFFLFLRIIIFGTDRSFTLQALFRHISSLILSFWDIHFNWSIYSW